MLKKIRKVCMRPLVLRTGLIAVIVLVSLATSVAAEPSWE